MRTTEQAEKFIEHSPDYYQDLKLTGIDEKHIKILVESYEEVEKGSAFNSATFRNWKGQSDNGSPAQLQLFDQGFKKAPIAALMYVFRKFIMVARNKAITDTVLDDIAILDEIGALGLLKENPVHLTPGATNYYKTLGTSLNIRWLRYIYLLKRILDLKALGNDSVWVDVGSYYGGLQGLVRKYAPETRIVMVDFHHQLCRSFIYLSKMHPDSNHVLPDELESIASLSATPPGSFVYVPVSSFNLITNQHADLVTNFFSLGEMRREFFNVYWDSDLFIKSGTSLFVNRYKSAPFFEETYDSDLSVLDYIHPDRSIDYFDIFPMHHFMQAKRELLGRDKFRNTSSSYFEMVTKKAVSGLL